MIPSPGNTSLIIPTLNAATHLPELLPALSGQSFKPARILIIDSSSSDNTAATFREFGAEIVVIPRSEFDHGGTRLQGVHHVMPSELVIFLTQDALPANPRAFENLARAFDNPKLGAAYGRQLPYRHTSPIGAHARYFNYPAKSEIISLSSSRHLGFRMLFLSNSFSAYRAKALLEVGGFPKNVIFGEDMLSMVHMLNAGWSKAYVADATVFHSHDYSFKDEFRRYFDIGVVHNQFRFLLSPFGGASGEGMRFVRSELSYLARRAPWLLPSAMLRTAAKYAAYKLGRVERRLPIAVKSRISMNRRFWDRMSASR